MTPDRLRRALAIAAEIVAEDGAAAVPIFARIEAEVAAIDDALDAIARARRLARGDRTNWQNNTCKSRQLAR